MEFCIIFTVKYVMLLKVRVRIHGSHVKWGRIDASLFGVDVSKGFIVLSVLEGLFAFHLLSLQSLTLSDLVGVRETENLPLFELLFSVSESESAT